MFTTYDKAMEEAMKLQKMGLYFRVQMQSTNAWILTVYNYDPSL